LHVDRSDAPAAQSYRPIIEGYSEPHTHTVDGELGYNIRRHKSVSVTETWSLRYVELFFCCQLQVSIQ